MNGWADGVASAMFIGLIILVIIAAVAGWLIIEGIIWIFNHVTIGVTP